jgi:hypothetical protein
MSRGTIRWRAIESYVEALDLAALGFRHAERVQVASGSRRAPRADWSSRLSAIWS